MRINYSKASIRVLYFITELNIGGAESALARTVTRLSKDRFNVLVACLRGSGMVAKKIKASGIPVVDLKARGKWDMRAIYQFLCLLRREHIQLLHSYMFHANFLGRLLGRLARIPIIVSAERTMEQESKARLWANRATAPLADRITAVSEAVRKFAHEQIGIDGQKLVTIYNGVDLSDYQANINAEKVRSSLGIDSSSIVIGTISRLEKVKGIPYLLQAFAQILLIYPSSFMLIVGNGAERKALEALAQNLGISSRVIFTGDRSDIPALLAIMDIFVLASLFEGLPNAVLEAMAMGKPVVATTVGGTPEVVKDGVTGLLVPPRDPDALAQAINALLSDQDRSQAMGKAARERVKRYFTVERMVERTEALYEELIRKKLGLEYVEGKGWQPIQEAQP